MLGSCLGVTVCARQPPPRMARPSALSVVAPGNWMMSRALRSTVMAEKETPTQCPAAMPSVASLGSRMAGAPGSISCSATLPAGELDHQDPGDDEDDEQACPCCHKPIHPRVLQPSCKRVKDGGKKRRPAPVRASQDEPPQTHHGGDEHRSDQPISQIAEATPRKDVEMLNAIYCQQSP